MCIRPPAKWTKDQLHKNDIPVLIQAIAIHISFSVNSKRPLEEPWFLLQPRIENFSFLFFTSTHVELKFVDKDLHQLIVSTFNAAYAVDLQNQNQ